MLDPSLSPSAPATADGTRSGLDSDASSTNHPPSRNSAEYMAGRLQCECRLTDAARARQGHNAVGRNEVLQALHSCGSTNEAGDGSGEVVGSLEASPATRRLLHAN